MILNENNINKIDINEIIGKIKEDFCEKKYYTIMTNLLIKQFQKNKENQKK